MSPVETRILTLVTLTNIECSQASRSLPRGSTKVTHVACSETYGGFPLSRYFMGVNRRN